MPSYNPSFAQAAAARVQEQMQTKCESSGMAAGVNRAGPSPASLISGVQIQFLANGFLVSPQMDYIGPSTRSIAHVARDRDELLKLVGEMIDAHAK